jgi:thiamine pyrophosphokinase
MPAEGIVDLALPSTKTIVVVAGGDPVDAADLVRVPAVPDAAGTIVADSGLALADALGLVVDLVVGDLDSVDPAALDRAVAAGAAVERHPTAKDATDLELALDAAVVRDATRIVVLGGHGGRLDHFLANVAVLSAPAYAGVEIVAHIGPATITIVRDHAVLHGRVGDIVSLLPQHGPARGVSTEGMRYPLHLEPLAPGSTRGVSNVFDRAVATVSVQTGVLAVVQPERAPISSSTPPTTPPTQE